MKGGTSIPRSVRLAKIQHFLYKNPKGLTSRELARLCGVCIRTIQRDLLGLQSELNIPLTQDKDRYAILGGYVLPPISFSLYEAMALFMAARLALRQTDENNPHMRQALAKMASALPPPLTGWLKQSVATFAMKPPNPDFLRIFESVALAWMTQRQMRIMYRSSQSDHAKEWLLEPYFVDMTGVGYSTYVIGYGRREGKEGITTFKLDRIQDAEILKNSFDMPSEFDIVKMLARSWGIIWGEETTVKLRFSPAVTRRVKESVWHPSQTIDDLPDGGCILTMKIGSTLEMTPWIRGWGPDVEVIEPVELREQFRRWAEQMQLIYRG